MKYTQFNCNGIAMMAAVIIASFLSRASLSFAAEHTLKTENFIQTIELEAVAVPTQVTEISIKPKAWGGFKIEKILPHGSLVNQGDTLIWIDTEDLDEAIENATKARVLQKLQLEAAQQGLEELVQNTPIELEVAQRKFDRYKENYDYYKETVRSNIIDSAKYSVQLAKDGLSYRQEELKQLQKMYEEDGLTEETEEIILQRAKNTLTSSERELKQTERQAKYTIEVEVPRKDIDWEKGFIKQKNILAFTKKTLERNLKIKQEEVGKLIRDDAKKQKYLDDLIADRKLMEFTSPAEGVVHYGEFEFGKWKSEKANKVLIKGGYIPADLAVMSIVPVESPYQFNVFLKEKEKSLFSADHPARLTFKKNPWASYAVVAQAVPVYPNLQHQWLVSFSMKDALPNGMSIVAGTKATISVVVSSAENVISVPSKAVTAQLDGSFTVLVKMAEGEPKETVVTVGRQSGDKLEITSGLEAGQVIITP